MERLTQPELLRLIDDVIFPNDQQLIQAIEHNPLLKKMVTSMYPEVDNEITHRMGWDNVISYSFGMYAVHNQSIWKYVSPTPGSIVEPGTDSTVWTSVPMSALTHPQNTDYSLGRFPAIIQPQVGSIDLRTSELRYKNEFIFSNPAGVGEYSINLITTPGLGSPGVRHSFMVYIAPNQNYTVRFSNSADMYIGEQDSILKPGFIYFFLGSAISPGGTIRTHLLFSTEFRSISDVGGGLNPFDQTLNKASSVDFQAVRVAGLAGATRAAVGVSITGQQERRSVVNLADVVLTGLKFRDAGNNNTIELRVVDNQILLIGVAGHDTT